MKKRTLVIISIIGILIIGVPITAVVWYHQFLQKYVLMLPDTPGVFESIKLGDEYSSQGRFKEAEDAFQKAIELDPNSALSYHELGMCYVKQERYDEATEMFNKVLKINPRHRGTQLMLSSIEVMKEANVSIERSKLLLKESGITKEDLIEGAIKSGMTREEAEELFLE